MKNWAKFFLTLKKRKSAMNNHDKMAALLDDSVSLLKRPPHKASIDPHAIKAIGKKAVEIYLTNAYGAPVSIREVEKWGTEYNRRKSNKFGYLYIAEVNHAEM